MTESEARELRLKLAAAYAAQSQSDFRVYLNLPARTEECHRLHYLQMACEKISKAYRLRDTRTSLDGEMTSHVAFSKFVDNLLTAGQIKSRYQAQDDKLRQVSKTARQLAREIEKLAPAVDREQSPVNAEYPWADGTTVFAPCFYSFPNLVLLKEPGVASF